MCEMCKTCEVEVYEMIRQSYSKLRELMTLAMVIAIMRIGQRHVV